MYEQLLPEFLKQIEIGSRSLLMYSEKHPRAQQVIQQAYDGLNDALATRENITVSVAEGNLLLEGQIVERGNPVLDRLSQNLFSRSVHSLTFHKGVTREEMIGLMHDLALKPQKIVDLGGFEKILQDRGIKNIQINKVKYGIINEEEGTGAAVSQNLIPDLLLAVQGMLAGPGTTAVASDLEKTLNESAAPDSASLLFQIFHTLAQRSPASIQSNDEKQTTEDLRKRFADLFRGFTPSMQGRILMSALLNTSGDPDDPFRNFYKDLNPAEREEAVLSMLNQPATNEQLQSVYGVIQQNADLMTERIREKFRQLGLIDASLKPSPCEELLQKNTFEPEEIRKVPAALSEAISQTKLAEADQLSKKMFSLLSAGGHDQKLAVLQNIAAVIHILAAQERWKSIDASVSFLVGSCYRRENDAEILDALQSILLDSFEKNYQGRTFPVCEELIATLRSRQDLPDHLIRHRSDRITNLQTLMLEDVFGKTEGFESAVQFLKSCGGAGAGFLLDELTSQDDSRVRANLIACIERMDLNQLLPELEKRISDERWYVLRNVITILGKLNLPQYPPFLEKIALHPEPRVGREIIKNIYKAPRRSDMGLLMLLLQHPDKTTRLQALHLISRLDLRTASAQIVEIARSAADTDVRTAALHALLQWRIPESVPLAHSILEKKNATKTDIPERNAAINILGKLNRDESRSLLQRIASSDPNPETRSLAASYL